MKTAREVANDLFNAFATEGMFNVSGRPSDTDMSLSPASTTDNFTSWALRDEDFAKMAFQAIGYEEGIENGGVVYVYSSKGSQKALAKVEKEVDEVPIRLRKLSPLSINPEQSLKSTNRPNVFLHGEGTRRACGSSCAPSGAQFAGTMGAIIRQNEQLYVLSNNHVIGGCNHGFLDTIIMSPATGDSVLGITPFEVGRLNKLCQLKSGDPFFIEPCVVDAALARITNPDFVTSWQGDLENGYDTPENIVEPVARMKVKKFGRTTGLTHGFIESKAIRFSKLPYKANGFNATVYFSEFWFVVGEGNTPFALPGDSGSLVVTEDEKTAVGLIFAVGGQYACFTPLRRVLDELGGGSIVSGHGVQSNRSGSESVSTTPE
ncbi:MAG: S1 family peptidase [Synergistaceae bacterium]|nr:S1 family peptidase [Synergistaceae bacterium]